MKKHLLISLLAFGAAGAAFAEGHEHGDEEHHEVLREGHVDLLFLYEEAEGLHLAIAAGEHEHGEEGHGSEEEGHDHEHEGMELDDVEIVAGAKATQTIPEGAAWSFLGYANQYIYILPQAEEEGLPFLGLNTEELDGSLFSTEPVLTLIGIEGPGAFALYQVDAFGQPVLHIQTGNADADSVSIPQGTHVHMNWAFTAPGEYKLIFTVSANLTDGTPVVSTPQEVEFHVKGQASYIFEGETEVALSYDAEHGLAFALLSHEDHDDHEHEGHSEEGEGGDHEHGDEHGHEHDEGMHPADAVILLGGYAATTVPEAASLAFLGEVGASIYLISQSEMEGVPFLGWSGEELEAATFTGDPVIELHGVEGPGDLFLYELDSFGVATVIWSTVDPAEDKLTLPAGAHAHYNLAVTAPGMYELELHAEATLADATEVDAHTHLILQAGGLEGYLGHFERILPDWLTAETGGELYTAQWPWLWNPTQGWLYAIGEGGPDHLYYHFEKTNWIWTSPEIYPTSWDYSTADWFTW